MERPTYPEKMRARCAELEAERDTLQAQLTETRRVIQEEFADHNFDNDASCMCGLCDVHRAHLNPPKEGRNECLDG